MATLFTSPDPATRAREWIKKRWERQDGRYYEVFLQPDLWGDWIITAVWGRLGSDLGQIRDIPCESYDGALSKLAAIEKRRRQHGYDDV